MLAFRKSNLGLLDKVEDTDHMVPYGDRSDTVIEPLLTDQWFVDAKKLAGPAIKAVKEKETIFTLLEAIIAISVGAVCFLFFYSFFYTDLPF